MTKQFVFKKHNSRITVFEHETGEVLLFTRSFHKQNFGERNRDKINRNFMRFNRDEARFILFSLTGLELSK